MFSLNIRENKSQLAFVAVGVIFIVFLIISIVERSANRHSVLSGKEEIHRSEEAALTTAQAVGSMLHLQDFHRFHLKNGNMVWDIQAKDANHFASEGVTHVNEPNITLYRDNQPPIIITSKAARLYFDGDALGRAELEGNVTVDFGGSLVARTEDAQYKSKERVITSGSLVNFEGNGFVTSGVGLDMNIDSELLNLQGDVHTKVNSEASVPKGLDLPKKSGK